MAKHVTWAPAGSPQAVFQPFEGEQAGSPGELASPEGSASPGGSGSPGRSEGSASPEPAGSPTQEQESLLQDDLLQKPVGYPSTVIQKFLASVGPGKHVFRLHNKHAFKVKVQADGEWQVATSN